MLRRAAGIEERKKKFGIKGHKNKATMIGALQRGSEGGEMKMIKNENDKKEKERNNIKRSLTPDTRSIFLREIKDS